MLTILDGQARPGQRPPLSRNTFVEVELRGSPKGNQVIVPTSALHEGNVYVLGEDNRLDIRKVNVAFIQGRYAVLASGLDPEEKLIVSDLIPSIQGMLLEPIMDKKTRGMLMLEVSGDKSPADNKDTKKNKTTITTNNRKPSSDSLLRQSSNSSQSVDGSDDVIGPDCAAKVTA